MYLNYVVLESTNQNYHEKIKHQKIKRLENKYDRKLFKQL